MPLLAEGVWIRQIAEAASEHPEAWRGVGLDATLVKEQFQSESIRCLLGRADVGELDLGKAFPAMPHALTLRLSAAVAAW